MDKRILNKIVALISLIKFVSIILGTQAAVFDKKTWYYELKSIVSKSSDPEKFNIDLQIVRVSRGVFAIGGEINVNMDIVEGDLNNVGVKSYRSTRGDGDYKILPFQVPSSHFFDFFNRFYKTVLMDTLKDCSDLPSFKDNFQPPLEKKIYKLDACQISQNGMPNHLDEGFYKIIVIGTGDVEWQIDAIVEVIPAIM